MTRSPKSRAEIHRTNLWRASPSSLAWRLSRGQWRPAPHLQVLARLFARAVNRGGVRAIVSMPPRHGKSELISRWAPVWAYDRRPRLETLVCSYSSDLATDFSRSVRDTIEDHVGIHRARIRRDLRAAHLWRTTAGGQLKAAGVNGGVTGRGADLIVIDDPIKSALEAYSPAYRNRVWDWYTHDVRSRLHPGGSIILVQTRWHEDDLAGRLIRHAERGQGEPFEIVNFPAVAEESDPLGRAPGAPLWPERYPLDELGKIRSALGGPNGLAWLALYQGRPTPKGGRLFDPKSWRRYMIPPDTKRLTIITSWDMAFSDLDTSSWVVGQVWGFDGGRAWLLDQVRGHWDFVATCQQMLNLTRAWPQARTHLVERAANGYAVISTLGAKVPGIESVVVKDSKEARAAAVSQFVAAGSVWLPADALAPWAPDLIDEARAFPGGDHDDQVDAMTQALSHVWIYRRIMSLSSPPPTVEMISESWLSQMRPD